MQLNAAADQNIQKQMKNDFAKHTSRFKNLNFLKVINLSEIFLIL